jgi:hypothetical protein
VTFRAASAGVTALYVAAGVGAISAGALRAHALPDGAPWEAALDRGCPQCHFDAPPVEDSPALAIDGLPERVAPGARYALVVRLTDTEMRKAGFLLSAWQADKEPAGRFAAVDARTAVNGAQARSTALGAVVSTDGADGADRVVEWALEWTAPDDARPVRFELWTNVGNDDLSPLGDTTHRRSWRVPPVGPSPAAGTKP